MIKFVPISRYIKEVSKDLNKQLAKVYAEDTVFEGPTVLETEHKLAQLTGRKHVKLVKDGSGALTVMLLAIGVQAGDEVICINYSCPATVQPILLLGAIPVFVDCNRYGQMDLEQVKGKITHKTKAIVVTSLYGDTVDWDQLSDVAIPVLNDSCQAVLNKYNGTENTLFGNLSILSFSFNKNIPIFGTYGAVLYDDKQYDLPVTMGRRNGQPYDHANLIYRGINSQPHPDKAAQVLCSLKRVSKWQKRKKEIHDFYTERFQHHGVPLRQSPKYSTNNYHKFVIFVNNKIKVKDKLAKLGVEVGTHYNFNFANSQLCGNNKQHMPNTEFFCKHALTLPNSAWHTDAEIETVVEMIRKVL